eukprot:3936859-Pleurochrysis_carterae.AAC.1
MPEIRRLYYCSGNDLHLATERYQQWLLLIFYSCSTHWSMATRPLCNLPKDLSDQRPFCKALANL